MEFLPAVAMVTLILKLIDFMRYARGGDVNGMLTQLSTWVAGVLVILLVAQTDWAKDIPIGDYSLGTIGFWSLVFYGMSAGSAASLAKDTLKAVDNTNSAAIPVLVPESRRLDDKGPKEVG